MTNYPIFTASELAHFMHGFAPNTEFIVVGNSDGSLTISATKTLRQVSAPRFTQADKDFLAQLKIYVDADR